MEGKMGVKNVNFPRPTKIHISPIQTLFTKDSKKTDLIRLEEGHEEILLKKDKEMKSNKTRAQT